MLLFSHDKTFRKGDQNHEKDCRHRKHDDGDVHVLHVHDFLCCFFRFVLHLSSRPLCRLIFCGSTYALTGRPNRVSRFLYYKKVF